MRVSEEVLRQLGRETGRVLGQFGVRPEDDGWIRAEAEAIASLARERRGRRIFDFLYRLARRAARTAR